MSRVIRIPGTIKQAEDLLEKGGTEKSLQGIGLALGGLSHQIGELIAMAAEESTKHEQWMASRAK